MYDGPSGKVQWDEGGPSVDGIRISREQASDWQQSAPLFGEVDLKEHEEAEHEKFEKEARELMESFAELNEQFDLIGKTMTFGKFCVYTALFPLAWAKVGYDKLTKQNPPPVDKTLKAATAVFVGATIATAILEPDRTPTRTPAASTSAVQKTPPGMYQYKTDIATLWGDQNASHLKASFRGNTCIQVLRDAPAPYMAEVVVRSTDSTSYTGYMLKHNLVPAPECNRR